MPAPAAKAKKGGNGKGPGRIPKPKDFKYSHAGCDSAYESRNKLVDQLRSHNPSLQLQCPNPACTAFKDASGLARHVYRNDTTCKNTAPRLPAVLNDENRKAIHNFLRELSAETKRALQAQTEAQVQAELLG